MKKLLLIFLTLSLIIAFTACDKETVVDGNEVPSNETSGNNTADTGATNDPTNADPVTEEIPPFDYMTNDLTPYLTLGQYEGLTATVKVERLTDEEYAAEVETLLNEYAYVRYIKEDRESVDGDNLNVNYEGSVDGKIIESAVSNGSVVSITENSGYIPGFAEGFIGHKVATTDCLTSSWRMP